MKKVLLVTGLLVCFSSCQKEYSCYCKDSDGLEFLVKTIKERNKEDADEACKEHVSETDVCYAK